MRTKRLGMVFAAALALNVAQAAAQSDPVNDQYQAYTNAIQRGDRLGAEAAAAAALAASEARDGEGGRTAVLALNLAQVRLDMTRRADALAPAQRAQAIASRNPNAGVNPTLANLVLGRAELSQEGSGGQQRISQALQGARSDSVLATDAFEAGIDLGDWYIRQERAPQALAAYTDAATFATGDTEAARLFRARSELGRGVAMELVDNAGMARDTGTRLQRRPDQDASLALRQAIELAAPRVATEASAGTVTRAQTTYGTALAWAHVRNERLTQMGWERQLTSEQGRGLVIDLNRGDGLPACQETLDPELNEAFGSETMFGERGVGVAVVRIVTDNSGRVIDTRVIGMAGTSELLRATGTAARNWHFRPSDATGCSKARITFTPVVFTVDRDLSVGVARDAPTSGGSALSAAFASRFDSYEAPWTRTYLTGENRTVIAYVPR